ncbi:MAG: histidinol dehydrogenase, partial [Myxococcota bacterium]
MTETTSDGPIVRLRRLRAHEIPAMRREPIDSEALATAATIVSDVRKDGWPAAIRHAERLGDIKPGAPAIVPAESLAAAVEAVGSETAALLRRTADQIRVFAEAQRQTTTETMIEVPGGTMGQSVAPVARAGCYAPGGRFPLPSTVLMTAVTARAAGVEEVWVASPRPAPATLAAAAIAGVDGFLAIGGAQAIAALTYGAGPVPAVDAVVGPGNRWVTAAKQLVSGTVIID